MAPRVVGNPSKQIPVDTGVPSTKNKGKSVGPARPKGKLNSTKVLGKAGLKEVPEGPKKLEAAVVNAAAGKSTYEAVDKTAAQLTKIPVAPMGGQQARVAALLNKGQINSPAELQARLDVTKSDQEAARLLAAEFLKMVG